MNKQFWLGVLILILAVLAGYFVLHKPTEKPATGKPIKIGIATILSGDYAALGENIVNTAKLEVADINKNGGIDGRPIELSVQDAGVDSKTGLSAVQKLASSEGIKYIIGGTTSNGTIAAAPLLNQAHVVYLTPVTGGKNVDQAGPYIFRIANSDVLAGTDLAQAMLKLGYKNVAVIAAQTEYTIDIEKTFKAQIGSGGGTVVMSEEFPSGTTDYRSLITKVRSNNPQAVLVLSQLGTDAAQFIKQSREAGYNPPVFTDFTLATNSSVKQILGSLDGIYFADPSYDAADSSTKKFFAEYKQTYGTDPVIPFHSASTYDGIMMLAQAIRAVGDDPVKVQQYLSTHIKNYHGLMGTYSLDTDGNSGLGFTVRIIKNGVPADITY